MDAPDQPQVDPNHGGLTLEQFASALAHVRHFPATETSEVLVRLGMTPAQWERTTDAWIRSLAEHATSEEPAGEKQLRQFGRAFAKARAGLKRDQPPIATIAPMVPAEPRAVAPAAAPRTKDVEPRVDLPRAAAALGAPSTSELLWPPPLPPSGIPSSAIGVADPNETVFLRIRPEAPAVPFGPPVNRRHSTSEVPDETLLPISARVKAAATPFRSDSDRPEDALLRAQAHARVAQGPERVPVEEADETALLGIVPDQITLPFGVPSADDDGETLLAKVAPGSPALPFTAAAPPKPSLTLEQYASLLVDLAEDPSRGGAILDRYGFSPDAKRAEDAAWWALMENDAVLVERFQHAAAVYRAWRARR